MEYQDYLEWQREQVLDPSFKDHHGNLATDDMKGQFVTSTLMLSVMKALADGLKTAVTPSLDPQWTSGTEKQRWMLTFNTQHFGVQTASVGTLFGEMSKPLGWADADKRNFFIGVGAPGRFDEDPEAKMSSDDLAVQWIPQARPAPLAPTPAPLTDYTVLSNQANGYDNGNFTNADRATLKGIASRLGVA